MDLDNSLTNSHTHCQAAPANAQTQAWQRVCLPSRTTKTTDKPIDEKEHRSDNRVDGSADCSTEYASHTTVRTVLVYGGSQIDGFSEM
jgi:hypothetical protein